jgi:RNA polymerase sigma-70 factor (ECF subfamily)
MGHADTFSEHRKYLFSLAYRMTGSAADAEDLVQETYLRWQQANHDEVLAPRAFLTTVITHLAINYLGSARVRREEYVGVWLPEPVLTSAIHDPAVRHESLTMAFLVLLESLTPLERAVFLLHEIFDYSHAETAEIVGRSEEACRQILRRAKQAVQERRPRFTVNNEMAEQLTSKFAEAMQAGNIDALMSMLHNDAVVYSDGGGRTRAALNPIIGKDRVARFLAGIARKHGGELKRYAAEINAQPGLLGFQEGAVRTALSLEIVDDRIQTVYIIVNPDKLQKLPKEESIDDNTRNPPSS